MPYVYYPDELRDYYRQHGMHRGMRGIVLTRLHKDALIMQQRLVDQGWDIDEAYLTAMEAYKLLVRVEQKPILEWYISKSFKNEAEIEINGKETDTETKETESKTKLKVKLNEPKTKPEALQNRSIFSCDEKIFQSRVVFVFVPKGTYCAYFRLWYRYLAVGADLDIKPYRAKEERRKAIQWDRSQWLTTDEVERRIKLNLDMDDPDGLKPAKRRYPKGTTAEDIYKEFNARRFKKMGPFAKRKRAEARRLGLSQGRSAPLKDG